MTIKYAANNALLTLVPLLFSRTRRDVSLLHQHSAAESPDKKAGRLRPVDRTSDIDADPTLSGPFQQIEAAGPPKKFENVTPRHLHR